MTEPNLTLGESSKVALPVRWAVLLGGALLALGGGVAVAQVRLSTVETDATKTEVRLSKVEEATALHAVHDASVDADITNIKATLNRIDRKLDRMMERRGVRTADGER